MKEIIFSAKPCRCRSVAETHTFSKKAEKRLYLTVRL